MSLYAVIPAYLDLGIESKESESLAWHKEIKEILVSKHPNLADEIYITYTSPFWKVRIGNCKTNAKAQELRQWIIAEFPNLLQRPI